MRIKHFQIWEWLFLPFVFLLPWQTRLILRPGILNGGNWEYGILGIYGTEILLWLTFLLWLIFYYSNQENGHPNIDLMIRRSRNKFGMTLLLALFFLFVFSAADKIIALQSLRYIIEAAAVFFLIQRFSRRDWLVWFFLAGLSIQSILAIWQFLSQTAFASRWLGLTSHPAWLAGSAVLENAGGRWLRSYGGLPHPNILGGYLAVGLVLIAVLLSRHIVKIWQRNLLLIAYGLQLAALFFTFSRSAWLALLIAILLFCYLAVKNKKYSIFNILIFTVLFFVVFSLFFKPLAFSRLSGEGRLEIQSTSERLSGYREAWQLFKKHPLTGAGLGNYTLAVRNEIDSSRPAWSYQPVHNAIVLGITELGIGGIFMLLAGFWLCKKQGTKNKEQIVGKVQLFLVPCSLFLVFSFFDHYLWSLYSGWMLLSVGGSLIFLKLSGKNIYPQA